VALRAGTNRSAVVAEPTTVELGRLKSEGPLPVATSTNMVIAFEPIVQQD
jgi:hypothetical protein